MNHPNWVMKKCGTRGLVEFRGYVNRSHGPTPEAERDRHMSTLLWLLMAAVYIVLFVTLALATLRKGHYLPFWVGIIFPVLWIIGALMGPTARAEARGAA
jgi:hypothetical protein